MNRRSPIAPTEKMKYGRYEYERTFLVARKWWNIPVIEEKQLSDKYLEGTQLRLRRVLQATTTTYKLTKKEACDADGAGVRKINTFYLNPEEYHLMVRLPGVRIEKTRRIVQIQGMRVAIDHIQLPHRELYLAEIEFASATAMQAFVPPPDIVREVTLDPAYSGHALAGTWQE